MLKEEAILSSLRIVAWAVLTTLGAITLFEIDPGRRLMGSNVFLLYVTTCCAWGLHLAHDHWAQHQGTQHHRGLLHLAMLILAAVSGTAMSLLFWYHVLADRVPSLQRESVAIVGGTSHSTPSGPVDPQLSFRASRWPGVPQALLWASNDSHVNATRPQGDGDVSLAVADLSLTNHETAADSARPGALTTQLAVTNRGPVTASRVEVINAFSRNVRLLEVMPSQGKCSLRGAVVSCALGHIAAGTTVVIRLVAAPQGLQRPTSTATVSAAEADPTYGDNTAVLRMMGSP